MQSDMLKKMFEQQTNIMERLRDHQDIDFPDAWPLDISKKENQKFCRMLAYECMGELFEAIQHLKNSKSHRISDLPTVDREEMIEELVDAQHYFLEILIMLGINPQEFFDAYISKGRIVMGRIEKGY